MLSFKAITIAPCLLANCFVHTQTIDYDPLNDFCRRFAHQTTVIDNRLYIDGGYVDYGGGVYPDTINYTNTFLLYLDLADNDPNWHFPIENAGLSKPSYVPSVVGGTLWADTVNKFFYLYGGEYNWTTPPPPQRDLWSYDALYDKWEAKVMSDTAVLSVSFGASVVVQDRALAYYLGGWLSNATALGWNGPPLAQPGLIIYDMVNDQWQNNTFIDSTPRAEGVMFYIPASDAGMLIYFGGVQGTSNGSYVGVPMNQIYLYDIASEKSYMQTTTGNAPGMRRRFCGGVSWAQDQSSYNIYFFGGLQAPYEQGFGYGDVWILSIPSFTWTEWSPSSNEHHSLTCNVIDESQMIIMGGYWPDSSNMLCDDQNTWGQHGLNLGANDVAQAEWYVFLPNLTTYQVPQTIYSAIGGGPTGGATLTTPANGWATGDLETYFTRQYVPSTTRKPTRDVSLATAAPTQTKHPSHSNVGAIAGGVVGGVVGLALILLAAFCCLRRRRKRREAEIGGGQPVSQPPPPVPIDSHPKFERHLSGTSETPERAQSPQMSDGASSFRTPSGGSPPPQFYPFATASWPQPSPSHAHPQGSNWAPVPVYYLPAQQGQQPQPYVQYQQPQQYFPPPPGPHQYSQEVRSSPLEMPTVQSPVHMADAPGHPSKGSQDDGRQNIEAARYA